MSNMKKYRACAACRYKRSKCVEDCPLAPYFPSHIPQQYKNAHKVFGDSHLIKLLRSLPPHKRSTAMRHLIAEAFIRVADPVGGSYGLIRNLQLKIAEEEEELRVLRNVLTLFRGCIVPGGFLHALFLQEQGNNMCVRDEVMPEDYVQTNYG
ncbi:LOB domain-containing protein 22-like [Argentina anserina]|uniref:LOB domain-containing protein 22-like n=1 Tax=Argentina anserina TaxID=57926 RepID=UPI0021761D5F|nr:LOB domain-containing protein 22-like [Potentilla anserina]